MRKVDCPQYVYDYYETFLVGLCGNQATSIASWAASAAFKAVRVGLAMGVVVLPGVMQWLPCVLMRLSNATFT